MLLARSLQILLTAALLTSQSAIDLSLILIVVFVFFHFLKVKNAAAAKTGLENLFLVWLAVLVTGYFFAATPSPFAIKELGAFRWFIELPALVAIWRIHPLEPKHWRVGFTLFGLAGLYGLAVFALGYNPLFESSDMREWNLNNIWRSSGFYGEAMAWSHTIGPLSAFCTAMGAWLWTKKQPDGKPFLIVGLLLCLATLLTLTRGVWGGVFVSAIFISFFWGKRKGLFATVSVLLAALVIGISIPQIRERALFTLDFRKTHDSERLVLWRANWRIFQQHPLLGIGYGENQRRLPEIYAEMDIPEQQFKGHAHNQYIHMLAGTGLIGFMLYVFFWFSVFQKSLFSFWRFQNRQDHFHAAIILGTLAAMVVFLIGGLTEANFSIAKNRMAILALISIALSLQPPHETSQNDR